VAVRKADGEGPLGGGAALEKEGGVISQKTLKIEKGAYSNGGGRLSGGERKCMDLGVYQQQWSKEDRKEKGVVWHSKNKNATKGK